MIKPKVSVVITTYNQEKYISQTLESVLDQKTNFLFEILIGEDCSNDKTRQICEKYAKKYPQKIKLIKNKKNLGLLKNFSNVFLKAKGEYIAILAGDDYWIDNYKIQKQVNFLEKNLDYSLVFTNVKKYLEKKHKFIKNFYTKKIKKTYSCKELISYNFIPALTALFKKPKNFTFPKEWNDYYPEDWPLFILVSQNKKIKYFKEPMAVYRVMENGLGSGLSYLKRLLKTIPTLKLLKKELNKKYKYSIQETIVDYTFLAMIFSLIKFDFIELKKQTIIFKNESKINFTKQLFISLFRNFKRVFFRFNLIKLY